VQLALEERNLDLAAKSVFKVLHNPAQPPIRNDVSFEALLELEQNLRTLVDAEVDK